MRKWLAHPAWSLPRQPPWNVEQVRAWTKQNLADDPAAEAVDPQPQSSTTLGLAPAPDKAPPPLTPERRAKLELTRERKKKLRFDREVAQGLYLLKTEVEAGRLARIEAVKSALLSLPRMAPALAGLAVEEIEATIAAEATKLLHLFSRRSDET